MGSLKLGKYFRVNASRSGISVSGGAKGFRLSVGSKGLRSHVTVPGTGYTKTNTLFSFKKLWKKHKNKSDKDPKDQVTAQNSAGGEQEEIQTEPLAVQDELVLMMARRRPFGSFTDKAKGDRLVNKGIDAYEHKSYEGAVAYFEEALSLYDEDPEVSLYLAVVNYLYLEDFGKALTHFKQLPMEACNEDMHLAMADCQHELGDFSDSIKTLESFKFDDDEDMERQTLLARNYMEKENYALAEALLLETIGKKRKMTPYLMEAKYWLGELYLRMKSYERAKQYLMAVYREDKTFEEIGRKVEELAFSGDEA